MCNYMIFGFYYFHPSGGVNDLVDIVNCKESLINVLTKEIYQDKWSHHDCIQVFDKTNDKLILKIELDYDYQNKLIDIEKIIVKKWCDLTITIVKDELDIMSLIKSDKVIDYYDEEIDVNTIINKE